MLSESGARTDIQFFEPRVSKAREPQGAGVEARPPLSYWLLLAFLLLLYANLPFILPATEAVRPAKVIGGAALLALLAESISGRRSLNFAWPEGFVLVAFLGGAALSCLTALWPRQAAESLADLVKMTLVFYFIVNCANTERRLRGVIWTLVICGLLPALGTLWNYSQGNLLEGRARWVGIFANPNEVAYSLIILIPLAVYLGTKVGVLLRLALLGICMVFLAAIFVTFSRGGLVALGAVVALYAWRKRSIWLQGTLLLVLGAGVVLGSKYWSRGEDFRGLQGDVSFRQRLATSEAGLSMFVDHPILGVGLGCSVIAWPLYAPHDLYSRGALVTHNTIIQPLGETGLVGFIPFMLFVGFGVYYSRKLARGARGPTLVNLGVGVEGAIWGFIVCGLSGGYVLTWFPYILMGLAASARRIQEVN
jgi:O-antigen ligase